MNELENLQIFRSDCSNIVKLRPSEVIQFLSGKFKNYLQLKDLLNLNKSKEVTDYEIGWYAAIETVIKILDTFTNETIKAELNKVHEQDMYTLLGVNPCASFFDDVSKVPETGEYSCGCVNGKCFFTIGNGEDSFEKLCSGKTAFVLEISTDVM